MSKYEFCLPITGKAVPAGPDWFHEIKYDGYRLLVERNGDRVRLLTRGGKDYTLSTDRRGRAEEPADAVRRRWRGHRARRRRLFRFQCATFRKGE